MSAGPAGSAVRWRPLCQIGSRSRRPWHQRSLPSRRPPFRARFAQKFPPDYKR